MGWIGISTEITATFGVGSISPSYWIKQYWRIPVMEENERDKGGEVEIWSWGAGTDGQLGTTRLEDEHLPQLLDLPRFSSAGPISLLACGGAHVLALTTGLSLSPSPSPSPSLAINFGAMFVYMHICRWKGGDMGKRHIWSTGSWGHG